jgi:hypothetical protein
MTQEQKTIWVNGKKLPVLTLEEALRRRGFSFDKLQHTCSADTKDSLVAYNPEGQAYLNAGGLPWYYCGGVVLFSFGSVREDSGGRYYALSHSFAISADRDGKGNIIFRLVQPC